MGPSNESKLGNAAIVIEYQELAIDIVSKCQIPNIKTGHRLLRLPELYEAIDNYDCALSTYEKALEFYLAQSSIDINVVCNTYSKIANIYLKYKNDYQIALKHLSTALKFNEEVNRDYHSKDQTNADIEIKLADIRLKLQDYEIAYHHLENALKIYSRMEQLSNQSDTKETESEEETTDDDTDSESSTADCSETEIEKIEKKMTYIQNILMTK